MLIFYCIKYKDNKQIFTNDIIGWIKFFLEAVIETSKIAKDKFRKAVELTMEMDSAIMDLPVKPENTKKVIDLMYDEPILTRNKMALNV